MVDLFLAKPDIKYKKSFEYYVVAYKEAGETEYFNMYKQALENFDGYLKYLNNWLKGIDLKDGFVKTSTFWLIDNNEVVGVTRVRHEEVECAGHIGYDIAPVYRKRGYGTEILKLALKEAEKIGIKDAIVTCNLENTASRKIIEKNKGELLGTVFDEEENENLYKYLIRVGSV
ncbi:GNAT family N-acetyltransferase [Clostridium neuense]|uniref:GNAT family N-acetyltransferase n=1 Tax=Clostridium neuense TaxID=1728934 RepID=A0ABW8TFF2_9CLOT